MTPWDAWEIAGRRDFVHHGRAIFHRIDGPAEAPALLLIHGFPTASWDWHALWHTLAARYRVLAPDLLGFGYSAKPRGHRYSLIEQADLCEALLAHHGVARYHVLAHDYGVSVAQELLARSNEPGTRPALASSVFLNGGLFPETHRPRLVQRLLLSPLGPWIARRMTRARFGRAMRGIFGPDTPPAEELLDGFWALIERDDGRAAMPQLIRYMRERRTWRARWVGALQQATMPLALINGSEDPVSGAHLAQRYRDLVPAPDVTALPGIGHYPQCEAPDAVLQAYLHFRATRTPPDRDPERALR
jgi:pimeloyl-ACP methyl ester carboxylesterase